MANKWSYFRFDDMVGLIEPATAAMMKDEIARIAKLVDSRKVTPVIGAIFLNSATTPTECLT